MFTEFTEYHMKKKSTTLLVYLNSIISFENSCKLFNPSLFVYMFLFLLLRLFCKFNCNFLFKKSEFLKKFPILLLILFLFLPKKKILTNKLLRFDSCYEKFHYSTMKVNFMGYKSLLFMTLQMLQKSGWVKTKKREILMEKANNDDKRGKKSRVVERIKLLKKIRSSF